MGDRLATIDTGRKLGGCAPFFGGGEDMYDVTQCGLGRGLPSYQVTSWSIEPFGHNRYGPKIGGGTLYPFGREESGSPCNNVARAEVCLLAKFHLDPSNRLATIHQRHRQDRVDKQRSDSIWRTVLQTVAQNELSWSLEPNYNLCADHLCYVKRH